MGGREGAVEKIEKIGGGKKLQRIKQIIKQNWSKIWFGFQLKIARLVFKNNKEKYAAQLSLLNTLLQENILTPKEYEKVKSY